jgi:hypothetical protein
VTCAQRILELAATGFSGTNSQWAVALGVGPATSWAALQRLVSQGKLRKNQIAQRVMVYGNEAAAPVRRDGKIEILIGADGGLKADWA